MSAVIGGLRMDHAEAKQALHAMLKTGFDLAQAQRMPLCDLISLVGERLAITSRAPPPPETLIDALHDRVHRDSGLARGAKSAKAQPVAVLEKPAK